MFLYEVIISTLLNGKYEEVPAAFQSTKKCSAVYLYVCVCLSVLVYMGVCMFLIYIHSGKQMAALYKEFHD